MQSHARRNFSRNVAFNPQPSYRARRPSHRPQRHTVLRVQAAGPGRVWRGVRWHSQGRRACCSEAPSARSYRQLESRILERSGDHGPNGLRVRGSGLRRGLRLVRQARNFSTGGADLAPKTGFFLTGGDALTEVALESLRRPSTNAAAAAAASAAAASSSSKQQQQAAAAVAAALACNRVLSMAKPWPETALTVTR